jgi:hypothetical protein
MTKTVTIVVVLVEIVRVTDIRDGHFGRDRHRIGNTP